MKSLIRKVNTFLEIPFQWKILFFQVIGLSLYRGFLVLIKSSKAYSETVVSDIPVNRVLSKEQLSASKDIAFAVQTAGKYIPWKNTCRHQSWQAIQLLNQQNIPYSYFVGVKKSNTEEGHSWVIVADKFICGKCDPQEYHLIIF
jgi:hypothetical protein